MIHLPISTERATAMRHNLSLRPGMLRPALPPGHSTVKKADFHRRHLAFAVPHREVDAAYPFVAVRLQPGDSLRARIAWTVSPLRVGPGDGGKVFYVLDPEPAAGPALTPSRRAAVLTAAQLACDAAGLTAFLAFASNDGIYLAPYSPPVLTPRRAIA